MKIIEPSANIMRHDVSPYEFVEKVGRTCYKSEDKITDGSAKKFVHNLIERGHWAMLEHETLYIETTYDFMSNLLNTFVTVPDVFRFLNITCHSLGSVISGSFRAFYDLLENHPDRALNPLRVLLSNNYPEVFGEYPDADKESMWTGCVKEITRHYFIWHYGDVKDTISHHLTHTVRFVCDRGVSHELVRHRVASFAQESTRYCNYSKDKFGNEITVIRPCFWGKDSAELGEWEVSCRQSEYAYFNLLKEGATPQEARSVLPNSLKTEIMITATEEEWQHIINLRYIGTTGAPHPQMKQVMAMVVNDLFVESRGRLKYEAD